MVAMDRVLTGAISLASVGAVSFALQSAGSFFAAACGASPWVLVVPSVVGAALTWGFIRNSARPGPDPAVAGDCPKLSSPAPPTGASISERRWTANRPRA
jgi:hypothetical protein